MSQIQADIEINQQLVQLIKHNFRCNHKFVRSVESLVGGNSNWIESADPYGYRETIRVPRSSISIHLERVTGKVGSYTFAIDGRKQTVEVDCRD